MQIISDFNNWSLPLISFKSLLRNSFSSAVSIHAKWACILAHCIWKKKIKTLVLWTISQGKKKKVEQENRKFRVLLRSPKVFHHCSADSSYPWSRTIRRGRDWPHGRAPRAQTCRKPACWARRPSMRPRRTQAQRVGRDRRGGAQNSGKDHWPIYRLWKTVTWIIKKLNLPFLKPYYRIQSNKKYIIHVK